MAMLNLGVAYSSGQGVDRDYRKALDWYLRAAEYGFETAMFNIGLLYANGTSEIRSTAMANPEQYRYDDTGRKTHSLFFGNTLSFIYNDQDYLDTQYLDEEQQHVQFTYRYEYDDQGNWIARYTYSPGYQPAWQLHAVTLRKLQYSDGKSTDTVTIDERIVDKALAKLSPQ